MLGYVQIVTLYFLIFNILYEGKERPALTKFMPAKLCAVLACAELTMRSVSLRGVDYAQC